MLHNIFQSFQVQDLYFSGLSLRKIARNINDHFDLELDYSTIYAWIKKYVPIISQYIKSLTPQLSDTWHSDEVFIKVRGGTTYMGKDNVGFLWNVMDRKTRFLLASKVSEVRNIDGAVKAFREAVQNAHGNNPKIIRTDAYRAYREGINLNFDSSVKHVAKCGVGKPHNNNNRMERLNGTLRERIKVQRGWKKIETPICEGQRIHYNFVKPHMALKGKTPAQEANLDVAKEKGNKWLDLLVFAKTSQTSKDWKG